MVIKGSKQVYPFLPCPLCGTDVELFQDDGQLWSVECPECNLFFGLPSGYSSRVDMARDWNKRFMQTGLEDHLGDLYDKIPENTVEQEADRFFETVPIKTRKITCPRCGQPIHEKSREEIYKNNAELLTAREWIDRGQGTLKEWVCIRLQCKIDRRVPAQDLEGD